LVLGVVAFSHNIQASAPDRATALPAPAGTIVRVASEAQLQQAIAALRSNVTIVLAPGIYKFTKTLAIDGVTDVVIRGATNSPKDVLLVGPGLQATGEALAPGAFAISGRRVTLADLTIKGFPEDAVTFGAGAAQPTLHHVRLSDSGRFVAVDRSVAVDRGTVEDSVFEYSATSRADYQTGAVSVAGGRGWIVRNNVFRNIRPPDGGLGGPVLSFTAGASATLIEGNTFIDAQQEIALGAANERAADRTSAIVRNNFIVRRAGLTGEAAITVDAAALVVHTPCSSTRRIARPSSTAATGRACRSPTTSWMPLSKAPAVPARPSPPT
jgi:hypothetical protein